MKRALRFPSRWAGWRTLAIPAALSAALGACGTLDNIFYGAKEGTVEYPGSAYPSNSNAAASYVVKYKDTVDSIAEKFGVSPQVIVDANKLKPPYPLSPGSTIYVPGARVVVPPPGQTTASATPPSSGPVKQEPLAPPPQGEPPQSAAPSASTPSASTAPAPGQPVPLGPTASSAPPTPPEPAVPPPRFEWPVHGKVVAGYGPRADGQKNDGIEIAADKGASVNAAAGGTVVYAGNEVRGMGNLLLISHPGGYITAYGYNEQLLVKKGDVVKKGQPVAKVGTSGAAADPRLHFEVRRGNKTVDPSSVLPAP